MKVTQIDCCIITSSLPQLDSHPSPSVGKHHHCLVTHILEVSSPQNVPRGHYDSDVTDRPGILVTGLDNYNTVSWADSVMCDMCDCVTRVSEHWVIVSQYSWPLNITNNNFHELIMTRESWLNQVVKSYHCIVASDLLITLISSIKGK